MSTSKQNPATPTPYPELNTVLGDLVDSIQKILGDDFIGSYLQGSFAVGDSDIHNDGDPGDFEDTLKFVQYIINESTLLYSTWN